MPKNQVTDPITDQEVAFAQLILSGTVTDRQAAETAGLNLDTAAYTRAKPRVQAWMHERRTAMNELLAQQEAEGQRQHQVSREQVLSRLWELASLSPERTRNSATTQLKALSLIIAIEGLIPDRRAASAEKKPAFPPVTGGFYKSAWRRDPQEDDEGLQPAPVPDPISVHAGPSVPPSAAAADAPPAPIATPSPAPLDYFGAQTSPAPTTRWTPDAFLSPSIPGLKIPYTTKKNPFVRY